MKRFRPFFYLILLIYSVSIAKAQDQQYDELEGADVRVYKTVDGFNLKLNIIYPEDFDSKKKYPAIIFFFGGGWKNGNVHQFEHQSHFFASKGLIAVVANYRVASRNNSDPFDAVEDAKSAVRFIRENAKELGINKNKIVAAGGSAGGHLAACTTLISGYETSEGKREVSSKPADALILFNPVINTMPEGFGYDRLGENAELISPAHHVVPKLPPILIFHGSDDKTVPLENILDFQSKMNAAGNTCYVVEFEGQGHGFFNYGREDNKYYDLTMEKSLSFLFELKYVK